jgi:type II secretory pathway component PulM
MKITAREKKYLIAGGAIVLVVVVFYAVTTLIPDREKLAVDVENQKRMLVRYREMIAQEDSLKSRLDKYGERLKKDMDRLLTGDTPSMAGAELQRVLSDIAAQNGVEINRKNARPEQKIQDAVVKVSVQIETNCGPDQLVQFLSAVENYPKFLTIDELSITSYRIQKRLEIHPIITVAGYIAAPEGAGDKTANGR